eukprot:gnl/Spiro4/22097_TR10875_c0_g1_i1.p1 gnl/Spiro4/22097_TR10875_c0_g1~~gnl/Spiro4/22097_TR10875_c0_g1_i1.p1  ORF type:complete len:272 (+),score=28.65 gnl/Spiro4/22097_TR10875_c0_g1_i1:30-818(+)
MELLREQLAAEIEELEGQRRDLNVKIKQMMPPRNPVGGGRGLGPRLGGVKREFRDRDRDSTSHRTVPSDEPAPKRLKSSVVTLDDRNEIASQSPPLQTPEPDQHRTRPSKVERLHHVPSVPESSELRARSRNLFGNLLVGTLKQFQKEQAVKSEAMKRKEELESRIEQKMAQEQAQAAQKFRRNKEEEREREIARREEITRKIEEKSLALLMTTWDAHRALLANFTLTNSEPRVYFRPKDLPATTTQAATTVLAEPMDVTAQ